MPHNYNDGCKITQENWEDHYPMPEEKGENWKLEFRGEYRKAYKGILSDKILDEGNVWFESFIEKTLAEERGEIVEIISKYNGMEEIIENGQRYLIDGEGNKIALGYPYLESKQQYIVRDILSLIHWNTNPNPNSTLLN